MLDWKDKLAIASGLMHFLRGYPSSDVESFASWLARTGQTPRAIRHFWEPVVIGALNDGFDRCSVKYAGKIFHETFLRSAKGGGLGIPAAPLTEFLAPVVELAQRLGVRVKLRTGVEGIVRDGNRWAIRTAEGTLTADTVILATDFTQAGKLMADLGGAKLHASEFVSAPITTVHLWYDRDVTDLDHAILLDTRIQWMFSKSRIRGWEAGRGSYLELVISASWEEIGMGREQILASALREVELFFPKVREARLVKSGVLKEARATFSVVPRLDQFRPPQTTELPGLYLAGDWTATEWPSTMEGAVRSGRLAAGAIVGEPARFMADETPATGLMRWLGARRRI